MPSLSTAYQWVINACNSPNIGYSMAHRKGETVNGITYYDCSSFISKALTVGGFYKSNPWFTTNSEPGYLRQAGFVEMSVETAWQPGDVLLRAEHTEMVYQGGEAGQGGVTMGAHTDQYPLDEQVSINDFVSPPSAWESLWRYPGGATTLAWISKNAYLTEDEMQNNAYVFYSTMCFKGFTLNAIAGMLGNMETESTINPGCWQNLDEGNYKLGFGLVQWTPATNYTEWATAKGYDIGDGNGQCEWLDTETASSGQWIPTSEYPMTWDEFRTSTDSPENLASVFLKNFERAGVEVEQERREQAKKWYDYLENMSPYPPAPTRSRKKLPLWAYLFP